MPDPNIPYPIEIQLTGSKIEDVRVTITNDRTKDTLIVVTDINGYAIGDAANFTNGYSNGDGLTASAINYSADFKYEIIDYGTSQQIIKERATVGTGTASELTKFFSNNKLIIVISEATENGNYELNILYEG